MADNRKHRCPKCRATVHWKETPSGARGWWCQFCVTWVTPKVRKGY